MIGNLVAAQFDLEQAIAELTRSGAATEMAQSQLAKIGQLVRAAGSADAQALVAMQASVAGLVGEAQAVVQQSRQAGDRAEVGETLAAVDARTRVTVQRIAADLFERRIFDPYLQFDSEEEARAYRQREAERQEYIRRELAKGTAEGALNATNATLAQIDDAGAHGADRSPEYARTRSDVVDARDEQLAAMRRAGVGSPQAESAGATPPASNSNDLDEIAAVLSAAGVQAPPAYPDHRGDHGLANVAIERGGNATGRST